jgi:hypothetical protein
VNHTKDFSLSAEKGTIFSVRLEPAGVWKTWNQLALFLLRLTGRLESVSDFISSVLLSKGSFARAQLFDGGNLHSKLDSIELVVDPIIYPDGMRLFAVVFSGSRRLRLKISGSGAKNWRVVGEPEPCQTLHEELAGYEEWYSNRGHFYEEEYFNATRQGASGYEAGTLAAARAAQEEFVSSVVSVAPFKSSIEFGCATGSMVAALRSRGVKAHGVDISSYAISQADPSIRDHLTVGDFGVLDDLTEPVDAIIGQEVFEHVPPSDIPLIFKKIHDVCSNWLIFTVPCMPHPGIYLMDRFENLAKDVDGNPVEGHLVQGSWSWWAAQAAVAGFELDIPLTIKARRQWHDNSRWWNLFVCRKCTDLSAEAIQKRLDKLLSPSYESLRQSLQNNYVATGRMLRREKQIVISCTTKDSPGYMYYGPYLQAERGLLRIFFRLRIPHGGKVLSKDTSVPAVHIEISSNRGIKTAYTVAIEHFLHKAGQWFTFEHEFEVDGEHDVQVKIYYVGNAEIEAEWPIKCQVVSL